MTEKEWKIACAAILSAWPNGQWPEVTRNLGWRILSDLDGGLVLAAVEGLIVDGREFPPPPGLIRRRAIDLATGDGDVLWSEVWTEVHDRAVHSGWRNYDNIDWSPAVRPFIEHMGRAAFTEYCLSDIADAGIHQAQWREKWKAWREREQVAETVSALPATKALRDHQALGPGFRRLAEEKRLK